MRDKIIELLDDRYGATTHTELADEILALLLTDYQMAKGIMHQFYSELDPRFNDPAMYRLRETFSRWCEEQELEERWATGRMVSDVSDTYNKLSELDGKKFPAQPTVESNPCDDTSRSLVGGWFSPITSMQICGRPDCPVCGEAGSPVGVGVDQ